jgi:hypothetical protein
MAKKRGSKIEIFNGFIKQVPRAMHYLLKGAYAVSIEAEDDISVTDNNGKIILVEQLKSVGNTNVLANASPDLWETLYNWIYNYVNETDKTKYADNAKLYYIQQKRTQDWAIALMLY